MDYSDVTILHLLGCNSVGKTTIMRAFCNFEFENVAAVSVGQLLRAKYPPEYFQGQMAPEHTEQEALQLYCDFVTNSIANGKKLIVIDGQPRSISQIDGVHNFPGNKITHKYVLIHADYKLREARVVKRDEQNQSALDLAQKRLMNDFRSTYEIMIELAKRGIHLDIYDSSNKTIDQMRDDFFNEYLEI